MKEYKIRYRYFSPNFLMGANSYGTTIVTAKNATDAVKKFNDNYSDNYMGIIYIIDDVNQI